MPVTFTVNVHEPCATMLPFVRETAPEPATAVMTPAPQEPTRPFGVATTKPAGNVSVNATPVWPIPFATGLLMVKVSVVLLFSGMKLAPKFLASTGGATTSIDDVAVVPVPPLVEDTVLVVLSLVPPAVPVTLTAIVHEPLVAIVPPAR